MPALDQVQQVFDAQALTSACFVGPITSLRIQLVGRGSIIVRLPTQQFAKIKHSKYDSNGNPWPRPAAEVEETLNREAAESLPVPESRAYRRKNG